MAQSIQLPVTQVGLEASINAAMKRVGSSTKINLGTNSKQISALSQPLGRITGQADEFSKSMAAANARVLAFGASAGIIAGVSTAMGALLMNTIKVEKSLIEIGSVLNKSGSELDKYGQDIFNVAKNTGQSFDIVAEGALELARQGLDAEKTLKRLNDALILSRLSGLDAAQSVEGLTAAINSFKSSGETSSTILNKLVAISQKYAVSERDLIESIKRSASVADLAGVSFNELAAITTAIQQKTARGGAVIGNSLKTIFARIQDKGVLEDLDDLGIDVIGASGKVLSATDVLKNLAGEFGGFSKIKQANIAEKLGGVYQLDKLLAALKDLGAESSVFGGSLKEALEAGNKAYEKNAVLNQSLDSLINRTTLSAQELGATLGKIGITDSLKNVLGFFNSLIEGIQKILGEEGALGGFVKGLVKGIGAIFAGPGLALFGAIILKLSKDLVQFGFGSLKIFFGIGKAAKEVQNVEGAISQILSRNVDLQQQLFAKEGNRAAQLKIITNALIEQEAILRRSSNISSGLAAPLYNVGARAEDSGLRIQPPRAAAGYVPATAIEKKDIQMGVGGAKSGDKPVTIPNFNFGGGKKGSIVANTGEYVVPNFAGSGGSAIFNRDMVRSMGLPEGAKKINAAGGFIPNFAEKYNKARTLEESRAYWKKAKKETAIAAFENPNTPENDLIGASETLAKGKSLTYDFDASKFQFGNGMGIGLVALQDSGIGGLGRGRLTSDSADIQEKLNAIGVPNLSRVLESKFKERNIDPNLFQGVKADVLQAKPNIAFENIKISSVNALKNQFSSDTFKDFQQTVNRLFARPISNLGNEIFGPALGSVESGDVGDKYIFGKDVLGSIFESATQFYIKGANNLPSFQDGEATRNQRFDFPMGNAEEAERLNSLFFKNGGVGIAEAKLTANASTLNSVVSKGLNNQQVISQMKQQIASRATLASGARGFIPNFSDTRTQLSDLISQFIDSGRTFPEVPQLNTSQNEQLRSRIQQIRLAGDFSRYRLIDSLSSDIESQVGTSTLNSLLPSLSSTVKSSLPPIDSTQISDSNNEKNIAEKSGSDLSLVGGKLKVGFLRSRDGNPLFEIAKKIKSREITSMDAGMIIGPRIPDLIVGLKNLVERMRLKDPSFPRIPIQGAFNPKNLAETINSKSFKKTQTRFPDRDLINNKSRYFKAGDDFFLPEDLKNLGKAYKTLGTTGRKDEFIRLEKLFPQGLAEGYIPNFANPLEEAIGREMSAGVPASQIYVDKNSSLKNAMNPMGLMVANRRDEPSGGFQGVNRARREGANPMMYGAASGFVPNYAAKIPDISGQVQSGLGAGVQLGGDVQDAINQFGKKAIAAGANMEKLAKALEKQLTTLSGNADAAKKVADESLKQAQIIKENREAAKDQAETVKAQAQAKKTTLSDEILNQTSNKKLAKQLDKVYLEYNKSAKTKQDLRNAETKASAILKNTSLKVGEQRAIVSSTGSLASTRKGAQSRSGGDRDMLGAIFGLQTAFSGLTGATEGVENGLVKVVNGFTSAASTATTALFAFQGLSQTFGGAETKIGGFLNKLGPYAAGIGFLYTGFNELTKYLDKNNVEVQKASESMLMVSEAASKAAINLSTLNPIQQERVKGRAEDVIERSRTLTSTSYRYDSYGMRSSAPTTRLARFEGVSDELKTGFERIISESLAAGVSETELSGLITSRFQTDEKLTSQEIQDISRELNVRLSKISGEFSPEKIIRGLTKEQKGLLQTMSPKDLEKEIAGRGTEGNVLKFLQDALYGTKDNPGITNDVARQENIRKIYGSVTEQADVQQKAEEEAVKQTSVAITQDKLKNALAMAIAKARSFENDQLGQTLLSAQELGNLDEKGLRNIQDRIALREIDRKLTDETSSIIQSQIDKAKEITANSQQALELEAKFQLLTEEDLRNPEKLKEILGETNALLSQGEALTTKEAEALEQKINALIENNQLEKDSLKLNQQKTGQFKEQVKQLDLISQASKRALEAQSFRREIEITKSINAGDLQVRALESSKLGASDSQVRQIDQQIAAIKANTVALEQGKEREKIFSQLKSELLENNKIADETTRKIRDNKIQQVSTPEALARVAKQVFLQQEGVDEAQQQQNLEKFIQNMNQLFDSFDVSSKIALAVAADETANAGRIAPVIDALEMFRRSLLETSQIIDQKIEDIRLQQLTSISGRELIQGNYDIETLRMQQGQTPEEAARIARDRQNKSVSQLFNEEFGKTEEERALDMKKTIVDASVQFKNNMIEGIMGAVEGTSSLKDGLRSAAYEFVKAINQKMINNLIDKVVGGSVQSGSGQTGGGLVGFLSGMFGMASGGMINGGSGMKDDVPAMLMGGEYVVNKKAVSKYGAQFLESLNNGTLMGYAKGGSVQKGPQGNFYTPGTFGQGAISGKRNLLDFATQTGTSGQFDQMINESGYQSVSLEPESSRLSVSGMRNSPMFEATQSAKGQAFDLYLQQYNAEREAKKAEKEQKKALTTQLLMLAGSASLGAIGNVAGTGAKTALANLSENAGFLEKLMTAGSGAFKGGNIAGTGQMAGGLKNLFSGNFSTAFRSGVPLMAGKVAGSGYGTGTSFSGNVIDNLDLPTWTTEEINKTIKDLNLGEDFDPEYPLLNKKAIGGMIPSKSGIDTVPAMLSGGEFVMNRSAVQGIGAPNLQSMNSGGTSITSEETSKELNEKLLAKLDELINSSGSTGSITINVAPSGQTTQETSQDPSAGRQQLARQIKDAVLQIINDEKRIGGTLRR